MKKEHVCMLIDAAISGEKNVIKKETEKILKYKDLTTEIQRMWNVKTSDTRNKRSNWNHFKIVQKIPKQHTGKTQNQGTIKKTAILDTAHIRQKGLL